MKGAKTIKWVTGILGSFRAGCCPTAQQALRGYLPLPLLSYAFTCLPPPPAQRPQVAEQ